ncbi:RING finger protein 151 [Ctenodactylus gundi]
MIKLLKLLVAWQPEQRRGQRELLSLWFRWLLLLDDHLSPSTQASESGPSLTLAWPLQSGGYDLNLFVSPPDCNFLCSVCHGVLKRPMRLSCRHIFCKKCILQWIARQNTCPCCRKKVKRKKMVRMSKLQEIIGRLEVKCKNAEAGCLVTCPLAHRKGHQDSCPFEPAACPNEGCAVRVPRGALDQHRRQCRQSAQQRCPVGGGATLGPAERARHDCYRELRDARSLLRSLRSRVRQVRRASGLLHRQLAQLSRLLREDAGPLGTPSPPRGEAGGPPEGGTGAQERALQGEWAWE